MRISDWSSDVCSSDLPRASNDIGIAAFQSPLRSCLRVSIKNGHVERARRFRFAFQFGKPDRSTIVSRQCTFRAPPRTSEGGGAFAGGIGLYADVGADAPYPAVDLLIPIPPLQIDTPSC